MTASQTDLLSDLIGQKYDCLTRLRNMGRQEIKLVEAGTMAELLDLLAAKQRMFADLQRIERALDPFRNQNAEDRNWTTHTRRQDCARRIEQCESLLAEIMTQHEKAERQLSQRRDAVAGQLQRLHRAGAARGAYAGGGSPHVSQIDLSSEA